MARHIPSSKIDTNRPKGSKATAETRRFGRNIARFREALGYSQEDLATQLQISLKQVTRYEAGESQPRTPVLVKLSEVLFRPIADFHAENPPDRELPLREVFALKVIDKDVSPSLVAKAETAIRQLNAEARKTKH